MEPTAAQQVFRYHEETKHAPGRYARSLGYLDWDSQPQPFRTYEGTTPLLLPLLRQDPLGGHLDLYQRTRNTPWDFTLESIAAFLELSLGLSAWKATPEGNRWALRMNPSSGNLHPTEAHLLLPPLERSSKSRRAGLEGAPIENASEGGVYHYQPYLHALEPRAFAPALAWTRLRENLGQGFLIVLTSAVWREAWKYGERALRYCEHDTGHALAALSVAGNLLGWRVTCLGALADEELRSLLGFETVAWPEGDEERPELACFAGLASQKAVPRTVSPTLLRGFSTLTFSGTPNILSRNHVEWPVISETAKALEKPHTEEGSVRFPEVPALLAAPVSALSGAQIIRRRRSALAFDGVTTVTRTQFLAILDRTLARNGMAPFDAELAEPAIDLAVFVHRVLDFEPGLYWFSRQPALLTDLKRSLRRGFAWRREDERLPLYFLEGRDRSEEAARICCLQRIAGAGAFAVAMVARMRPTVDREPWRYRQLFWECGQIGQVLYLEAEAQGVRGTGIGCYFDDEMHSVLGLQGTTYQSLYHFTVGGPVEDPRLQTSPPYGHLPKDRL